MKKITITEARNFLAKQESKDFKNIYAMVKEYVRKYDNNESQYYIEDNRKN